MTTTEAIRTSEHAGSSSTTDATRGRLVVGGSCLLAGALLMIAGAIVWATTGADLDSALADGTMSEYLSDAAEHHTALMTNLGLWIVGASLLGFGGASLAGSSEERAGADVARGIYLVGAAAAVVAFGVWSGLVHAAHLPEVGGVAEAIGFSVSRIDWVATIMLIGVGPLALVWPERTGWAPGWLRAWSGLTALAGLLTVVAMVTGDLDTLGFVIVPLGAAWSIAAGAVAIRRGRS